MNDREADESDDLTDDEPHSDDDAERSHMMITMVDEETREGRTL